MSFHLSSEGQSSKASDALSELPIVVDLDGTLLLSDTLYEAAALSLFRKPLALMSALPTLSHGRHVLKATIAKQVDLTSLVLPFREDLVNWLRQKAGEGHALHLCSAADQTIVDVVAAKVGIFNSAVGSSESNLKGPAKARYLASRFPEGFIYVGDSGADLSVWAAADAVVLAGASGGVAAKARKLNKPVVAEFSNPPIGLKGFLKAIRVHHWTKNVLIFVPMILAHEWANAGLLVETLLAFLCLLAVTSGTYLLNDIADLHADRQHWSKRNRAMASGRLSIRFGFVLAVALIFMGFVAAALLSLPFASVLLGYFIVTGAYSLGLKRIPLLDTLVIGLLFTSRVVMGAVLLEQSRPAWLLTFAVFFFFSLAVAKRHTEIVRASTSGAASLKSRGYEVGDAPLTLSLGVSAAMASLVVLVIFILLEMLAGNEYARPEFLSAIPVLLSIWLGRIWILAHRGRMNDDPVSFAIRDKTSIGLGVVIAIVFLAAL
ncbi:UbiA family prenyltransferase [Agrobacterium tumefaciens]|uniref:UbiA family prenyltransferase n=1 Tax=Agrobacterium tumefaciens TaxID=358 RepID=UPI000200AF86|nr:UbiA family prenyltransferase [Agrobacterium tumefaciens]ADY65996.1 ubiA prenyltransferase family protein [Agrobacterium tumefaciens]